MNAKLLSALKVIYPAFVWDVATKSKVVYLTFDDGPVPEITEFVLDNLLAFNAKATFFCVGDNVIRYAEIFKRILAEGHQVGNHSHNHLNGWKTDFSEYIENYKKCEVALVNAAEESSKLYRPPYGRITKKQGKEILKTAEIIMWSVLTKDYDPKLLPEDCLRRSIKQTKAGSIVLFHDNIKAKTNLMYTLPRFLKHFSDLGYAFEVIGC